MRSASSNANRASHSRWLALLAALALLVVAGSPGGRREPDQDASAPMLAHRIPDAPLDIAAQRALRSSSWAGGTFTAITGETVRVLVSESYPEAQALGQRWADFLASLLHGTELGLVTSYVLTPAEMRSFCGPGVLGCYGGNELAFMGETIAGVTPEEVARHEYGHHVAANRPNPPWLSVAWGPKRWASAANVCLRAQRGQVYPGDEDAHYVLNPGEGFAEVFRVLNELKAGAPSFAWSLVDPSFAPDTAALQAAEQDVLSPWSGGPSQRFRGRFTAAGRKVWKVSVPTPLDGKLAITLTFPRGSFHELVVLAPGGRVLAKGLWAGGAEKKVAATLCGERSIVVRVTRGGPAGPFVLHLAHD